MLDPYAFDYVYQCNWIERNGKNGYGGGVAFHGSENWTQSSLHQLVGFCVSSAQNDVIFEKLLC